MYNVYDKTFNIHDTNISLMENNFLKIHSRNMNNFLNIWTGKRWPKRGRPLQKKRKLLFIFNINILRSLKMCVEMIYLKPNEITL